MRRQESLDAFFMKREVVVEHILDEILHVMEKRGTNKIILEDFCRTRNYPTAYCQEAVSLGKKQKILWTRKKNGKTLVYKNTTPQETSREELYIKLRIAGIIK